MDDDDDDDNEEEEEESPDPLFPPEPRAPKRGGSTRRRWRQRLRPSRLTNQLYPALRQPCVVIGFFVVLLFITLFVLLHARDFAMHPYQAAISFVIWLLIGLVIVATAQTIYITVRYVCN